MAGADVNVKMRVKLVLHCEQTSSTFSRHIYADRLPHLKVKKATGIPGRASRSGTEPIAIETFSSGACHIVGHDAMCASPQVPEESQSVHVPRECSSAKLVRSKLKECLPQIA